MFVTCDVIIHLMTIVSSVLDSTWVVALCCQKNAMQKHLAYIERQRKHLMLSDVEKGNDLMLTRLTPVATLSLTMFDMMQNPLASICIRAKIGTNNSCVCAVLPNKHV